MFNVSKGAGMKHKVFVLASEAELNKKEIMEHMYPS
jgi:hypothetical protein